MNTEHTIASRYDEVVFENRNKEYGAYFIRRSYDSNLSKSTFASFLFVACLFGMGYAAMMVKPAIVESFSKPPITLGPEVFIIPEHVDPPPPAKNVVKQANTVPTRVVTQEVETPPVDVNAISNIKTDGVDGPEIAIGSNGPIESSLPAEPVTIQQPQVLIIAEVMPEFEGGMKALYKYLRKTLRYPAMAQRIGEEGIVYVRFVIDAAGAVTGVEVMKGVSAALDKEATRVISLMPHWKAGKQHGSPVNVRMTLPIKFQIDK